MARESFLRHWACGSPISQLLRLPALSLAHFSLSPSRVASNAPTLMAYGPENICQMGYLRPLGVGATVVTWCLGSVGHRFSLEHRSHRLPSKVLLRPGIAPPSKAALSIAKRQLLLVQSSTRNWF